MAKKNINYNAIGFKNNDIDKFSTKFGNGDPEKTNWGQKMMTFGKESLPVVDIRTTNNTVASDNTAVKTAPKPTGPSKPSSNLAAAQREQQMWREVDKSIAESKKKEEAKKAEDQKKQQEMKERLRREEEERNTPRYLTKDL
jgi:type IV secretory pathway VirB10-like protein